MLGRGCWRPARSRLGGGLLALAPPSNNGRYRYFGSGKWEPPPPPTREAGERPKCVVLHCTPPRSSNDARRLEEVGGFGFQDPWAPAINR